MTRRILFSLATVALLATFAVAADDAKKERKGPRGDGGALFEKLNLSDDQKAEIAKIHEKFKAAVEQAKADKDREGFRKAMEDRRAAINGVLTDEQREQLKKLIEEAKSKRGKGDRKPGDRKKRPDRNES